MRDDITRTPDSLPPPPPLISGSRSPARSTVAYMQVVNGEMSNSFESLKACAEVVQRYPGIVRFRCAVLTMMMISPDRRHDVVVTWPLELRGCFRLLVCLASDMFRCGEMGVVFFLPDARRKRCSLRFGYTIHCTTGVQQCSAAHTVHLLSVFPARLPGSHAVCSACPRHSGQRGSRLRHYSCRHLVIAP